MKTKQKPTITARAVQKVVTSAHAIGSLVELDDTLLLSPFHFLVVDVIEQQEYDGFVYVTFVHDNKEQVVCVKKESAVTKLMGGQVPYGKCSLAVWALISESATEAGRYTAIYYTCFHEIGTY